MNWERWESTSSFTNFLITPTSRAFRAKLIGSTGNNSSSIYYTTYNLIYAGIVYQSHTIIESKYNQSINQSQTKSINQSIIQSIIQSVIQSLIQSWTKSINRH